MTSRLIDAETCDRLRRLCQTHDMSTAARIVGVSASSVANLRRRGWRPAHHRRRPRPMPTDFAIQCGTMTMKELCRHYGAGDDAVRRWARAIGRVYELPHRTYERMPVPDGSPEAIARYGDRGTRAGLADAVAKLGAVGAAEAYGVSYGTLRKWRRSLGLPISWSRQPGARRDRAAAKPSQIGWVDQLYRSR